MTEKLELTKPSENTLKIYAKDEAEAQRQVAQTLTSPSVNAALIISASKIVGNCSATTNCSERHIKDNI